MTIIFQYAFHCVTFILSLTLTFIYGVSYVRCFFLLIVSYRSCSSNFYADVYVCVYIIHMYLYMYMYLSACKGPFFLTRRFHWNWNWCYHLAEQSSSWAPSIQWSQPLMSRLQELLLYPADHMATEYLNSFQSWLASTLLTEPFPYHLPLCFHLTK